MHPVDGNSSHLLAVVASLMKQSTPWLAQGLRPPGWDHVTVFSYHSHCACNLDTSATPPWQLHCCPTMAPLFAPVPKFHIIFPYGSMFLPLTAVGGSTAIIHGQLTSGYAEAW